MGAVVPCFVAFAILLHLLLAERLQVVCFVAFAIFLLHTLLHTLLITRQFQAALQKLNRHQRSFLSLPCLDVHRREVDGGGEAEHAEARESIKN